MRCSPRKQRLNAANHLRKQRADAPREKKMSALQGSQRLDAKAESFHIHSTRRCKRLARLGISQTPNSSTPR